MIWIHGRRLQNHQPAFDLPAHGEEEAEEEAEAEAEEEDKDKDDDQEPEEELYEEEQEEVEDGAAADTRTASLPPLLRETVNDSQSNMIWQLVGNVSGQAVSFRGNQIL